MPKHAPVATMERAIARFGPAPVGAAVAMLRYGMFASGWPSGQQTVWDHCEPQRTYDVEGPQIDLAPDDGLRYCDLYHVSSSPGEEPGGRIVLSFNSRPTLWSPVGIADCSGRTIQTLMTK